MRLDRLRQLIWWAWQIDRTITSAIARVDLQPAFEWPYASNARSEKESH